VRVDLKSSLTDALEVCGGELVSIVGAGGKTSLLYGLGRELSAAGKPTLLTTTTRIMYPSRGEVSRVVLGPEDDTTVGKIRSGFDGANLVLAGRERSDSKIIGYDPGFVERLHSGGYGWTVVAECDGARGKSLKVPNENEPPLAASTGVYVVVTGADSFHKPVTSPEVFNPEGVASVSGVGLDATVSEPVILEVILSSRSYLGRKPAAARMCVFINKVDIDRFDRDCFRGGGSVFSVGMAVNAHPDVERVVIGSIRRPERRAFLVMR
jgi:probable selenium-dependent hydroxylase accessory protein YqeC